MKILPFISAVIAVLLPVAAQRTGLSQKHGFKVKMLCAFMYIVIGALSALALCRITAYSVMIFTALILGALGDFFLEYKSKKFFSLGAAFFGIGHIVYSYTFLFVGTYKALSYIKAVVGITVVILVTVLLFVKLKFRRAGKNKLILAYAPVLILAFVSSLAGGIIAASESNLSYGLCLTVAGILFLSSDIMIGLGKLGFQRPNFLHNAVSYTYFAAQTLFALSIYFQ